MPAFILTARYRTGAEAFADHLRILGIPLKSVPMGWIARRGAKRLFICKDGTLWRETGSFSATHKSITPKQALRYLGMTQRK